MVPRIGYKAAHELFTAQDLVEYGVLAEQAGFDDFIASDHFVPWQDNQGHAGLAWLTMAALGQRTRRIRLGTAVTCPTYRYNPAIVAQAFATLDGLCPGRVFLGVGTGEAINEVATGGGWGPYKQRAARLREAIRLIRQLWTGEWVTFDGTFYTLREARLYDRPENAVPIYVAASGPATARLAGEEGDGLITVPGAAEGPLDAIRTAFADGATSAGKDTAMMPVLCELYVVVDGSDEEALRGADLWRLNGGVKNVVEIADPRDVQRQAREQVDLRDLLSHWVVSSDPQDHIRALRQLGEDGFTHVYVHSPEADQRRFIEFYARDVLSALRATKQA